MNTAVQPENFFNVSKAIVEGFIQSVVAVDDRMVFDPRPSEPVAVDLIEPDHDAFGFGTFDENEISERDEHKLHYQDLSSAFAKKGIVCSGFQPLPDPELTKKSIVESSKNADITILDWQMDDVQVVGGTLATAAILDIINSDLLEGGRLRLVTVYTAEDSEVVLRALKTGLRAHGAVRGVGCITFSKEVLRFCKIDVVSKAIFEKDLSNQVIVSFTELTAGLLSNAALSAISDMRSKTHNILYKFNKSLDPAYLSHVLGLISSPGMREQAHEVAFDYTVDLISEEIKSQLQTSEKVKKALSRDNLSLWPAHVNNNNHSDYFGVKVGLLDEVKFGNQRMVDFLQITTNDDLVNVLNTDPKIAEHAPEGPEEHFENQPVQLSAGEESINHHLELSALECIRRDVKTITTIPVLKQGTILKKGGGYYVCIQPLCDSVRLTCSTEFTFLRVDKVTNVNSPFSHVIRSVTGYVRLNINPSSKKLRIINFSPCPILHVVKASDAGNGSYSFAAGDGAYSWCGEFKQPISQAITTSVAASMSRVGFDTFEWLRIKARQALNG